MPIAKKKKTVNTKEILDKSAKNDSTVRKVMFLGPDSAAWRHLGQEKVLDPKDINVEDKSAADAKANREELRAMLLASLQMQHVVVLAGSGTSLGSTGGPSMWKLWDHCVNSDPDSGAPGRKQTDLAKKVINEIGYKVKTTKDENIESLLSRCEAYLQVNDSEHVTKFLNQSKKVIQSKCSEFINPANPDQLSSHRTFLHRLSRRRVRDSRLKVFTTNYDLCFEKAAGLQGLVVLDGFSFTQPRQFDPRYFQYDIVRRNTNGEELGAPLEGVFHIYKLHGSVNWTRKGDSDIEIQEDTKPESACMIYPAKGKYQQSYIQPHLELVSQFFSALREPNTCIITVGFGFNDDHLSEPILAAVRTNPHLRLIVVNPLAEELITRPEEPNKYWETFNKCVLQGEDVWFINANFGEFSELIPDLKSLTPAQRLSRNIKQMITEK